MVPLRWKWKLSWALWLTGGSQAYGPAVSSRAVDRMFHHSPALYVFTPLQGHICVCTGLCYIRGLSCNTIKSYRFGTTCAFGVFIESHHSEWQLVTGIMNFASWALAVPRGCLFGSGLILDLWSGSCSKRHGLYFGFQRTAAPCLTLNSYFMS